MPEPDGNQKPGKRTKNMNTPTTTAATATKSGYSRFLLLVAGLGGLLYGVDVGIIAGAAAVSRSHFRPERGPAFLHRRRRAARQCGLHFVRRNAHSLQRHEHCAADQSGRLDGHRRDLPADCRQVWLLNDILRVCGLHSGVFHHCGILPARDKRQDTLENRRTF